MIYGEAYRNVQKLLKSAGIENEISDAWFLMEEVCGINRSFYFLHEMEEMPGEQYEKLLEIAAKRCERIPLQYLTGQQEFMGLAFKVTPDVLIPRQDTEILAETALNYLKPGMKVLDLCTGSGCIAVSLKHYQPEIQVTAADISAPALKVAAYNSDKNQTEIRFLQSDLFEKIEGEFDVIVSNPPYIPSDIIETLMPEVRDYEPRKALDGTGDGLYFYRKIAKESILHLKEDGILIFEIGCDQGQSVPEIMSRNGFAEILVLKDLAGLDRVAVGRRAKHV